MSETLKKKQTFPRRHLILLGLVLLVVVGAVWFFCSPGVSPRKIRRVILISIDTCRADYLSCYGYPRKITPNIDVITQEGILFENTITPVPLTLPAHSSMLTGTDPPYHGVHDNHGYFLGGSNITLAEILKGHGFTTAAFVSTFVMDSQFGLDQGFDTYYDRFEQLDFDMISNERRGGQTTDLALEWLQQNKDEKFFLFLHYYDPHTKYEPPEPFASKFSDNLYAGEIAFTDYCIGRFIQKLKALGLFDSALIIITGDHGEMLGEHGEDEHGYFIYQSAVRVPLIFKLPHRRESQSVKDIVGLIDIVPTICSLLGIKPPAISDGQDLSQYFTPQSPARKQRYLYTESLHPTKYNANSLLALVTNRFKFIQTTRPELYDLAADPNEEENLIDRQPQQARILRENLRQILQKTLAKRKSDSKVALDEQTRKRLESLGYVGAAISENFKFDRTKEDPKDLIDFHLSITKLYRLISERRFTEAKELCHSLSSKQPGNYEIYASLGKIAFQESDIKKGKAYMLKSLSLNPNQTNLHNHLGMVLAEENDNTRAISHFTQSLRLNPNQKGVHFALANIYDRLNKFEQAVSHYTELLQIAPDMAAAHNNLASLFLREGNLQKAAVHCTKALKIDPQLAEAHYNLGNIMFTRGQFEKAVTSYEKALSLRPNWPEARMNLDIAKKRTQLDNL